MPYYKEQIKREPNIQGRPRLVSVLADIPGARHHGFDGDGTPGKRGEESGRSRLWEFPAKLDVLPDEVIEMTSRQFNTAIDSREAKKPVRE